MYASKSLDSERVSWSAIVYTNLIKAIRIIFAELDYEASMSIPEEPMSSRRVQQEISKLRARLLPLVALENTLASELSGGSSVLGSRNEACVRSGWQSLITPKWAHNGSTSSKSSLDYNNAHETTALVARMLASVVDDIDALWTHDAVMFYIKHNRIRLEESAAYFFRHIQRIAEPEYIPTNDDILHVRLRTLGVMQHSFTVKMPGTGLSYDWRVFDVGGAVRAPTFVKTTSLLMDEL
jgi:guanine nucleotide-binding protein subunit alpha